MSERKGKTFQEGGVNIEESRVSIGGDLVGRDKITHQGVTGAELVSLTKQFEQIRKQIEQRPEDQQVDKVELKDTVNRIETEVKKGEEASTAKLERWLRFLADMADDIFELTAATLTSPAAGIAKAIQLIVKKVKETQPQKS